MWHRRHRAIFSSISDSNSASECEAVHTSLLFLPLKSGVGRCHERGKMAQQPDSLGFRFALILALLTVIILTLSTWLGPKTMSKWAAPASEPVYRAQHLNLY
jgi:hypothetical protein